MKIMCASCPNGQDAHNGSKGALNLMDGLSFQESPQVLDGDVHQPFSSSAGSPSHVRGDVAVGEPDEWIAIPRRLLGQDVDARGIESAFLQGLGQRSIVDEGTSSCIDQDGRRLHPS